MPFSIEKSTVTAKVEIQNLSTQWNLHKTLKQFTVYDAETELANILSAEIFMKSIEKLLEQFTLIQKKVLKQTQLLLGIFDLDTDSNGRWSVERFKGLMFQLERDANAIAQRTRRGKGNIIICSSDVASALQMAGILDYTPALNNNLNVDDTGNTFAGVLNGRFKVYIDPYSANQNTNNSMLLVTKVHHLMTLRMFYCPYVPLQMVRAVGQDTFQPKIGFKTRYGLQANPFAEAGSGDNAVINGAGSANSNRYYRKVQVTNLA